MRHAILLAVLLLTACGDQAKPDPWRADARQLLLRTERLAEAGDVEAAKGTLAELENREDPALKDRGRAALARALLKAGRTNEAQQLLLRVPWADKSPEVAGELLSLDLAIRWRALFAGDRLASGMIPAVEAPDSDQGRPGGAWESRQQAWNDWRVLLAGGVRMAEREGVRVAMPAGPGLLALARWTHGDLAWREVAPAIAGDAEAQLAAVHLHLAEHDPESALREAESLWQAEAAGAGEAYGALRLWQLRRRLIDKTLVLWPYPAVDARLDALAARFAAADGEARAVLTKEGELGDVGLRQALQPKLEQEPAVILDTIGDGGPAIDPDDLPRVWKLALEHDGLRLSFAEQVVAAGMPATVNIRSDYAGPHHLELWRIADPATWAKLRRSARREDLPERPDLVRDLPRGGALSLPGLAEGMWVAAVSARACPVVALASLRVAATALHLRAGVDGALAWTVGRSDGRGAATPLRIAWQLVRDPQQAGGKAWQDATAAWRAGFAEGFLGQAATAFVTDSAAGEVAAGRAAGAAAAAGDPAFSLEQQLSTATGGVLRLELPPALAGRPYELRVAVDRPDAHEAATASWGTSTVWSVRMLCWADKPLVRPGETLRFAGILREYDGEGFRRSARTLAASLRVGRERVWQGLLTLDARGMLQGAAPIPAGAAVGEVVLEIDGESHRLARCDRLALPQALISIECADPESMLAGETRRLRVRVTDAAGAPLATTELEVRVTGRPRVGHDDLPCDAPRTITTDLAGEATLSIPTPAGSEGRWLAILGVKRDGRSWYEHHAWTTSLFPFPVEAELDESSVSAGAPLRVHLALPARAQVRLQLARGDERFGTPLPAVGGADGRAEVLLPTTAAMVDADALLLCASLPGGGTAERRLAVRVGRAAEPGQGDAVACQPLSTRVRTGDRLEVTVGTSAPGRDVLLLAGTGALIHQATVNVPAAAATLVCEVGPAWSPEVHLEAVAWLPGRGFTTSRRSDIRVLPVDRLLRVTLTPDRAEPRPGERVRVRVVVRDWQDRPVAGAGLTLGAVDQRLYALAEDDTPDLWRFFHDHGRPWRLRDGCSEDPGSAHGLLWRSVIWRWQVEGEARSGGGNARAYGRGGGCRACTVSKGGEPSLGCEADPTIAWIAGVVTDERGECEAVIDLPAQAGSWRLTARAADTSAAVMVGEVRLALRAARTLDLQIQAPRTARVGDRLVLPVEVANHGATAVEARLVCAGTSQVVAVGPRTRRTVPMAWTVTEPAAEAPVRRLGGRLGRVVMVAAAFAAGTPDAATAEVAVLVVPDGLPEQASFMLVAGADGALRLPVAIPAGSLVHAEIRAWPDAGARRDEEVLRWRNHEDARGTMAWLLAPAGGQRRAELARRWEHLDQSPEAQVVRLAALRLGLGGGGVRELPEGPLGDWLRARARLAGLRLAPPLRRTGADSLRDRSAIAGTALAEGWGEGQRLWTALRAEVLASDDALVLALALDAARLASDGPAQPVLAARLVGAPWDDAFAAVLAAELIPAAGPARALELGLAGETVAATTGAVWSRQLQRPLGITAPPGAVVSLDLRWQPPPPASASAAGLPQLELRVDRGEGFRVLRPGEQVQPGERIALAFAAGTDGGWQARFAPPAGLRPVEGVDTVRLSDPVGWAWRIGPADQALLGEALGAWREGPAGRKAALTAWSAALTRAQAMRLSGSREAGTSGRRGDDVLRLSPGEALLLDTTNEGDLGWPGVRLQRGDAVHWLALAPLRIGAGTEPTAEAAPDGGVLLRALAAAPTDPSELAWLLDHVLLTPNVLQILVPAGRPDFTDLLAHPACGVRGHWSEAALRRYVDGEPALEDLTAEDAAYTISDLAALVGCMAEGRDQRRQALARLPAPQAPPRAAPATLRAWYEAAAKRAGSAGPWSDWLWQQDLTTEVLAACGQDATLDGWAAFLRSECGLPVRLGPGCSLGEAAPTGGALGTRGLADAGLALYRQADGTLLVDALDASPRKVERARLNLAWRGLPFHQAVAALDRLLENRGLPRVQLEPRIARDPYPAVTLELAGVTAEEAVAALAQAVGLQAKGLGIAEIHP